MQKMPMLQSRAARCTFLVLIALAAGCSGSTLPAEASATEVELRGPLEERALMQSEYQRIR
jgi:hypothetical protein